MSKGSSLYSLDDFHENIAAFNHRHRSPKASYEGDYPLAGTLRAQLITEELAELLEAIFRIHQNGLTEENVIDLMDAYGDLLYVVIGTGATFELPTQEILQRVCESNDTKHVTDDPRVRSKGPDFRAPEFRDLARRFLHG